MIDTKFLFLYLYIFHLSNDPEGNLSCYHKLVGIKRINKLRDEGKIDTVYVRYFDRDDDQVIDCHEPLDMIALEKIMREHSENVMGWRLWHHNREVDEEDIYDNIICGHWYQDLQFQMILETPHGDSFLSDYSDVDIIREERIRRSCIEEGWGGQK